MTNIHGLRMEPDPVRWFCFPGRSKFTDCTTSRSLVSLNRAYLIVHHNGDCRDQESTRIPLHREGDYGVSYTAVYRGLVHHVRMTLLERMDLLLELN